MNEPDFVELCVRHLDDACTPAEVATLAEKLASDPAARAVYRDVCRHATWMREAAPAAAVAAPLPVTRRRPRVSTVAWAAAAAVVLVGSVARLWPPPVPESVVAARSAPREEPGTLFFYPFDGFPLLEPPDDPPPPDEPFRIPRVSEPDPRIVAIARRLHGLPPALSLEL